MSGRRRRARKLAAVGMLVLLVAGAGCTSVFGGGAIDEEAVEEPPEPPYDWDRQADATIDIRGEGYRSIYAVEDRSVLEVYGRDTFGMEQPLSVRKVRFRFENGTVVAPSFDDSGDDPGAFNISTTRDRTIIGLPAEQGQLAFTVENQGKAIATPLFLEHSRDSGPSFEVILPPDSAVAVPLLSNVRPGGYETSETANGRVSIFWEEVTTDGVSVRFYLDRDLLIFGSIAGVLAVVGIIGAGYYLLRIRRLEQRRQEIGLDIEREEP
jgi:hypothetical protein